MKKVVRLTESDLKRIVKKVISENSYDKNIDSELKVLRKYLNREIKNVPGITRFGVSRYGNKIDIMLYFDKDVDPSQYEKVRNNSLSFIFNTIRFLGINGEIINEIIY